MTRDHLSSRRKQAAIVGLAAGLLFNFVFLPEAARSFFLSSYEKDKTPVLVKKEKPEPDKQKDKLQYVIIDEKKDEEIEDPLLSQAQSSHSRIARQKEPIAELPKGAPSSEKGVKFIPMDQTRPSPPQRPSMPIKRIPQEEAAKQEPIERKTEDKNTVKPTETLAGDFERIKEEKTQPKEQTKKELVQKQEKKAPPFVDVRNSSNSSRPRPVHQNTKSSADYGETRSMQLLRARWGDYMDELIRKLRAAWYAELSAARKSFSTGRIRISFGINADGSVKNVKLLQAPDNMVAEKDICWRAINNASPFGKLTDEMQKDENFEELTVNFLFW
ncbi:MAG: hypothetical protein JXR97_11330 [Planctomycetes bacterium]|nr:hypothetical protein [Planctomycetota bacterium]